MENYEDLDYNDVFSRVEGPLLTFYMLLTILLGTLGNSFVVYASTLYSSFTLDAITILFVKHLAVTDLIKICSMNVPMFVTHLAQAWVFGETVCLVTSFYVEISTIANLFFILVISGHRFLRCCFYTGHLALISKEKAMVICGCIWTISTIPGICDIAKEHNVEFEASTALCYPTRDHTSIGYIIELTVVIAILLMILMLNTSTLLYAKYKLKSHKSTHSGNITLFWLSVCLILSYSWVPYVMELLLVKKYRENHGIVVPKLVTHIMVGSVVANPLVYTFANKKFNRFVKRTMWRLFPNFMHMWRDYRRCPKVKPTNIAIRPIHKDADIPKSLCSSPRKIQGIVATLETVNVACETTADEGDFIEKIVEDNAEYNISTTKHEIEDCPIENSHR